MSSKTQTLFLITRWHVMCADRLPLCFKMVATAASSCPQAVAFRVIRGGEEEVHQKSFILRSSCKGKNDFPELYSRLAHTSHWPGLGLMSLPRSIPSKWECDSLGPIPHGWQPAVSATVRQMIIRSTLWKTNLSSTSPHLERREVQSERSILKRGN